jgi:dephospho-CoA kinase
MGSGKSEVASRLRELGAHVIEADAVSKELVRAGSDVYRALVESFGESVVSPDGSLDRRALAELAFSDERRTAVLNAITHPALIDELVTRAEAIERAHPDGVLVVDAALLVQWDLLDMFDLVVVVIAPAATRVDRMAAAGYDRRDVERRIASQLPDGVMREAADKVIENTGSLRELRETVDRLWESLPAGGWD